MSVRPLRPVMIFLALAAVWLGLGLLFTLREAEANEGEDNKPVAPVIDYNAQIKPIFEAQCISCHDAGNPSGGLALHTFEAAKRGGDSGGRILGGPVESNVLWDRVSSNDPDFRMPKGGQLTNEELALIRLWIEQGSPWPGSGTTAGVPAAEDAPGWGAIAQVLTKRWYPYALVGLLVLALLGFRIRDMQRRGAPVPAILRPFAPVLRHVGLTHVLTGALVLGVIISLGWVKRGLRTIESLKDQVSQVKDQSPIYTWYFGDPPRPYRPDVPKRLSSVFYRGNCERTENLFNGGRYRTATLELDLVDRDRNLVKVGDTPPEGGLYIRFVIRRSPNTADTMYDPEHMARVFLSPKYHKGRQRHLDVQPITLTVLEPRQAWEAMLPIGHPTAAGVLRGWFYVYQNLRTDGRPFTPKVHYGIRYDLSLDGDGALATKSDLWMGNLFWTTAMEPPPRPWKLPAAEWFHEDPIPEIPDGHPYHSVRNDKDE